MINNSGKFIAAVDIGTNSFHMIIAQAFEDNSIEIVDRKREVLRLGSANEEGFVFISEEEIYKAVSVLKEFKELALVYNADLKVVATSAVREAENKFEFIEKIFKETGIKVDIIEGSEEARLIFQGIKLALPVKDKKVFCIDIGGGSTEFIFAEKENIIFAESLKIGAVRLTKKFFPDFILTGKSIKNCEDFIEQEIISNKNLILPDSFLSVGASGTIMAAARLINNFSISKTLNGFSFSNNDLQKISSLVFTKKTKEERAKIPGMEEKRADIIPAGLLILNKIFKIFNIKEMIVSEFALREGIISATLQSNNNFR